MRRSFVCTVLAFSLMLMGIRPAHALESPVDHFDERHAEGSIKRLLRASFYRHKIVVPCTGVWSSTTNEIRKDLRGGLRLAVGWIQEIG